MAGLLAKRDSSTLCRQGVASTLNDRVGCTYNLQLPFSAASTSRGQVHLETLLNLTPSHEPPVLLHSSTERNLLALLCADWRRQLQLSQIALHLSTTKSGYESMLSSVQSLELESDGPVSVGPGAPTKLDLFSLSLGVRRCGWYY